MKKVLVVLASLCLSFGAFAQDVFYSDWYMQIQGGAGETIGETDFKNLISPAAALSVGYQFTPTFGLRGNLSGWQAKGAADGAHAFDVYKFNYAQLAVDATFDLCNMFGGYKLRAVNPYIFAGIGGNLRFNNGATPAILPTDNYYWKDPKVSLAGRLGAGIDFRVAQYCTIGLEVVENCLSDHFNSKVGDIFDHQINALVGVKFSLGTAKKKAAAAAALAAAEAEAAAKAAQLAAEKAAAEKAAAEKAAAEAAAKAAAEKAAAEKAAAEAAAAARAAARAASENVLFVIDHWNVRENQEEKVNHIIDILNQYPEAVVTVTGYADKATGTSKWNMTLSQRRAEAVAKKLIAAGVDASRITSEYRGSEENPFPTPKENRVAVCVTK